MTNRHYLALAAGFFYLVLIATGGWSEIAVRSSLLDSSDAAVTAANVSDAAGQLRLAFAADMVMIASFLLVGLALYTMLRNVSRDAATAMLAFNGVSVAVMSVNLLNHAALLLLEGGSVAQGLGAEESAALTTFFLELHAIGYMVAQVFFGLYLLPLGFLVYRSGWMPRWIGVMLMAGWLADMAEVGLKYANPGANEALVQAVAAPAGIAELSLAAWLVAFAARRMLSTEPSRPGTLELADGIG